MREIYKLSAFITGIIFFLTGCNGFIQGESDEKTSPVLPESAVSSENAVSAESVPEASETLGPREWGIELEEGYEPKDGSGLYQEIKPSVDIPYRNSL